ncbi:hypothetical protein, partial [Streptomyces sp. NRRL WC-3549]|uniref:hypothetical protein n=1 Tax=Streptomyces sp. NRRL WC-3549 TaxID=1463925 RepID=UPI0007C63C29
MPLPFLTADRVFDASAEDTALPFDDHDSWRRPYRPGPWWVAAAATLLLLASFVLLAAMIIAFAGSSSGGGACFALAAVVIVCALRLLRVGAWVSSHGVRRVAFFRTTTVAWGEAEALRTVQPVSYTHL